MNKFLKVLLLFSIFGLLGSIFYDYYPNYTKITKNGITYQIQGLFDQEYKVTGCNNDSSKRNVIIPDQIDGKLVTEIADEAFANCNWINSVTLPNTIERIGKKAFSHCTGIETLNLNEGIKIIDEKAFEYCSRLKSLTLPSTLEEISLGGDIVQECVALPSGRSGQYNRGGKWLEKFVYYNGTEENWNRVSKVVNEETFTDGPFDRCDGIVSVGTPWIDYDMGKLNNYEGSCSFMLAIKCLK